MKFNLQESIRFLEAIEPVKDSKQCFVVVLKDNNGKRLRAKHLYGTFDNKKMELMKLNKEGYEIFVAVNELKSGERRSNAAISSVRACFVDSDTGNIEKFNLKPSMIIQSSRGEHAYWIIKKSSDIDSFVICQKGLISNLKTDPAIVDPSRCMRLPGFYSHTDKTIPFLVTIKQENNAKYDLEEIMKTHPIKTENLKSLSATSSKGENTNKNVILDLAIDYIDFSELRDGFIYYADVIFKYTKNHYTPLTTSGLKASILQYLQQHHTAKATGNMASQIFQQITALGYKGGEIQPPCFLNLVARTETIVPLENGLLRLEALIANKSDIFIPHSSDYFSLSCLPYRYDPNARCPNFIKFLKRVQPDKKVRLFIQEWFGYNLIPMTRLERMAIFAGAGANGKTVLCTVLRELLGESNVSSVPLEQFSMSRPPYQLAETVGKLANIHEEFSGSKGISEGVLKQFITGSQMTFERKMQQPFNASPTARLTFCTNELPQFKDRSTGLWRRMICIPFDVQILPSEQKTELLEGHWWVQTGEMPGVLNWALRGLIRLWERGEFVEPAICATFKSNYKDEVNPTQTFFEQHCFLEKGAQIGTTELYRHYKEFMRDLGQPLLSMAQFAEEIRRHYAVKKTPNAVKHKGTRERLWIGLSYKS